MWKRLLISVFLLLADFGLAAGIYFGLPDTAALNNAKKIQRKNVQGQPHPILIRPGTKNYIPFRQIPKNLRFAVIFLEDGAFYQHRGFDFRQIQDAISDSVFRKQRLRGASTISQQLVKNLYLSSKRSFVRKLHEALITIKLELTVPKWKILELYFNCIDWGKNQIGIHSASFHYFNRHPSELSAKEIAYLAAIIPNPARFGGRPDKLFVRKQMLKALERLHRAKLISLEEYRNAIVEQLQ